MRVSTLNTVHTSLTDASRAAERYAKAQTELSTGKKLLKPSDDPAGMSYALGLKSSMSSVEQYQSNVSMAKGFVSTTESALGDATTLMRSVRTLVVQASSTQMDDQTKVSLQEQIDAAIDQLAQIGNTTYGNRHVFGGQRTTDEPYVADGDTYTYQGGTADNGDVDLRVDIGPSDTMTYNVAGDKLFSNAFTVLSKIRDDIANGNTTELSNTDLADVDTVRSTIMAARAEAGVRLNRLDDTDSRLSATSLQLEDTLSTVRDTDVATAAVELQTAQMAYQAALTAASKTLSMNLLDFIG